MSHGESDDVETLLSSEHELTPEQMERLREVGHRRWLGIQALLGARAHAAYATADPDDWSECVYTHMGRSDRTDMVTAAVYQCPRCGRLLKDRQSVAASVLLLERSRLRELWLQVEEATPEKEPAALDRFRKALGLAQNGGREA